MSEFKQELLAFMKRDDLNNRHCADCGSPNPGWTSLSHAVLICLSCAGTHRGLGVHISFVRSMTMDDFSSVQMEKMRLGGNAPFTKFMQSYSPVEQGGYREGMSIAEKYGCWAATQYREKLSATVEGKAWEPSAPPSNFKTGTETQRPSSAQGLRKSRAATRNAPSNLRSDSSSSSIPQASTAGSGGTGEAKTASEKYFASLGEANANRRDDLPPSQGGKYTGFGSASSVQNPSFGTSSASAPSLNDFSSDPVGALGKGWSLFSSAVVGASRAVSDNVMDPSFQESVKGYVSEASRKAGELGKNANVLVKDKLGVDVADQVGGLVGTVRQAVGGTPGGGYEAVAVQDDEHGSRLYADDGDGYYNHHDGGYGGTSSSTTAGGHNNNNKADGWKDDWAKDDWKDDEWKSF